MRQFHHFLHIVPLLRRRRNGTLVSACLAPQSRRAGNLCFRLL
ncbi:hypothetical protein CFter6_0653 [Collimonas fungivorans]|uniref:Uncharacterized protein n=1 Tax=Collimonas fungivorans TaxID=158899 RepID=A0A127P6E7_9BURK|nr:hypothetical protein CFter6_0653 [Collimonas fungivorans]